MGRRHDEPYMHHARVIIMRESAKRSMKTAERMTFLVIVPIVLFSDRICVDPSSRPEAASWKRMMIFLPAKKKNAAVTTFSTRMKSPVKATARGETQPNARGLGASRQGSRAKRASNS